MEKKLEELNTERLLLRSFAEKDAEAVNAYGSNPENVTYMTWGPSSMEDTKAFIEECIKKTQAEPVTQYEYAIVHKETGRLIGGCGIYLNESRDTGMLGWILHKDYWRQGYTAEAGAALLEYGFHTLKLHRIYATCNAENYGSYRVMEKLGMRREAHFIKNRYGRAEGESCYYDEYYYAILEEEYERNGN